MRPFARVGALIVLTLGMSAAARAGLLVNGGFESDLIAPGFPTNPQTPAGWHGGVASMAPDQPGLIDPSLYGMPHPEEGNQYVQVDDNVVLSQQFLAPASGLYTLTWFDNWQVPVGNSTQGSIPFVTFIHDIENPSYTVSIAGTSYQFKPVSVPVVTQGWTEEMLQLNLTGGTDYTLAFQGPPPENGNSWDLYNSPLLDNVDLEGPSSSVPDAGATFALLAGALASLAALRRRLAN